MKDIAIIMYSHTDYSDIWPIFFGQTNKYLKEFSKYIFVNNDNITIPDEYSIYLYNDADIYKDRVISCLQYIKEEFCIFHHEDMFLYDVPNYELLNKYIKIINNENLDFIKTLRTSEGTNVKFKEYETLYEILPDSNKAYGIQPFIWKTKSLLDLYKNNDGNTIWEFEANIRTQTCRQLNIKGAYHYNCENKRGFHHWDSKIWPYVATAIVKGKWNYSEYSKELSELCNEYRVNINERGLF